MYINGEWQSAASGKTFESVNPATGEVLGSVPDGDRADTRRAIAASAAALPDWRARNAYERADILVTAHRLMLERREDLATLMTKEQGKPLRMARNEVGYAADFLLWFGEEAKRVYGEAIPSARTDQRFLVLQQPVGVCAAITPWNYPISMITRKVAPAVAAGCTSVLKPAEQTPLCAVETFRVFADAGVPPGVVNLVTCSDPELFADEVLAEPTVRKISFTGSTDVGKMIAARAGATMKRVSMELGGHAPFLVFPDADPEHAAKGAALVKFLNSGQACICPNRFIVHSSIAQEFIVALRSRVEKLVAGDGLAKGTTIGPLIDDVALKKMTRQVDDAVDKGAQVVVGGTRLEGAGFGGGAFFAPTILSGVSADMLICSEETFGPIAPVLTFDDEEEAVAMANATTYGLAGYIYTRDISRAFRVAESLDFGMIGINDINPTSAAVPFGGIKESGLGREGARAGLSEYLDTKVLGIAL